MGPVLAIVAVGTVLALAFSSARNGGGSIDIGRADRLDASIRRPLLRPSLSGSPAPDHRNPGRTILAQGLQGGDR